MAPPRKQLKTYYASRMVVVGRASHGGSILPPHLDVETSAQVRCPEEKSRKLRMPVCRVLETDVFGNSQLLYHGSANPESQPFPDAAQDHLRWYAFEPNMSLDYIREEALRRTLQGQRTAATLYVYRVKRPLRNMLLFADATQWEAMGGMEHHLKKGVCGVTYGTTTPQGQAMAQRALALSCPFSEYARAVGMQKYRVMRGDRGEHINGWVRVNSVGAMGTTLLTSKGFECLLTHPDHASLLELVDTYNVVDSTADFGTVAKTTEPTDGLEWHLTAFSPTPTKAANRRAASPPPSPRLRPRRLTL